MNPRFALDPLTPSRQRPGAATDEHSPVTELPVELLAGISELASERADNPSAPREFQEIDGLFLPEGYEPNYAYPLLVWLSTVPVAESEFRARMRRISDRNYVGVSIPVDSAMDPAEAAARVRDVVCAVRREFHIHSERIILAGTAEGGAMALEIGLHHPGWFGGIIALGGALPTAPQLLSQFNELHGFRVLLAGCASTSEWAPLRAFERVLWSAGIDVDLWQWATPGTPPSTLLRELDRWVMSGVERESAVWV